MTQEKAAVFETEVVAFPAKTEAKEVSIAEEIKVVEIKKATLKIDINKRFSRFRKSTKKRSASIF